MQIFKRMKLGHLTAITIINRIESEILAYIEHLFELSGNVNIVFLQKKCIVPHPET